MTVELSKLESVVYELLKGQTAPIDRNQLAKLLGRRVLNPHDKHILNTLAERGLIEVIEKPMGIARTKYEYRAL